MIQTRKIPVCDRESDDERVMYINGVVDSKQPLEVEVEIENRNIKFELDQE